MNEKQKREWHEQHNKELQLAREHKRRATPVNITEKIATRDEIAQFLTGVLLSPDAELSHRLQAADKLTKLQGYIRDKEENSSETDLARVMAQVITNAAPQWQQHINK